MPYLSPLIQIFRAVFKGGEDVFAIRWEKQGKSGYMPAYQYDAAAFRAHQLKGGKLQDFAAKTHRPLSDTEISKHLNGEQQIGIYPLLPDNTSWFVAADFDKDNWLEECILFLKACTEKGIPAYLERSRSGKGGHVWVFFESPYPAFKSRKIMASLLEESGLISVFDKGSSFDRLFPNQDTLSGKGLGNLIALPLYKKTLDQGNSCFLDPLTLETYPDQFEFLKNIQKVSASLMDALYQSPDMPSPVKTGILRIILSNAISINRNAIPSLLINFLKEELNFVNTAFIIQEKVGRSTYGTDRFFKLVEETGNEIFLPRGFIGKLIRFCKEQAIEYDFLDNRLKLPPAFFSFQLQLRSHQQLAMDLIGKKDFGVIVAPPGSGKTIIGLKMISDKQQPGLIIVHRRQLMDQWMERIEAFLGIPQHEIGRIGNGKNTVGKKITIATIQSLSKVLSKPDSNKITNVFGTIIVDECHHIPAETYRNTIGKMHTFYLYGLTATPFRKYSDGKMIFAFLGEIIAEVKPQEVDTYRQAKVIIRNTALQVPFNSKTDTFEILSKVLAHDSARNKLILEDVTTELKSGKRIVIITERKEHIDTLHQYLKQSHEVITLSGEDSDNSRNSKWKTLKEGNFQVLITTGQYFGEGSDLDKISSLFLVYPFSFQGKLVQYIGRVQRSEITPTIYDYRDIKIDYLNKMFLKRNTYYRKIDRQATLFDDPVEEELPAKNNIMLDKEKNVLIADLEFRYGGIAFRCHFQEAAQELEFEIENLEVRPEFEVLKPYFTKALKSKQVKVKIHAELENGKLVAQLAESDDLKRINHKLIESVKFKFIALDIIATPPQGKGSLLTVTDLQEQTQDQHLPFLYKDGQELLDDILRLKTYKHSRQLQYLAQQHESTILKVRFVLQPFSFVFLLNGESQYHLVLETLDTEEATYIWHFEKDKSILKIKLQEVDEHLSIIRSQGRQAFLATRPDNFSRILHDYTDEKKGFILWKGLLEERLV